MFRVLRLHNAELEKVYGFCFPKVGTDSMVTKVEVSFDVQRFTFKAKCIQLVIGDVQSQFLHQPSTTCLLHVTNIQIDIF